MRSWILFRVVMLFFIITKPAFAATTLGVTLQVPLSNHLGQNLIDFKNEVEKTSHGDLKIQIYPSAQLFKDSEVHHAVQSGMIQMGVLSLTQLSNTIPAVDVFSVPFLLPTQDKVDAATRPNSPVRRLLDKEILKTGTRPLWWQPFGSMALLSKDRQIERPEQMKNVRVRVFGRGVGELVQSLGATPVYISGSNQSSAYEHDSVDAGITGVASVGPRELYKAMHYMTIANFVNLEFVTIINEKDWQALTANQRHILSEAARKVEEHLRHKIRAIEKQAIFDAQEQMSVVRLNKDDIKAWKKASEPALKTFLNESGVLGRQVVDAAEKL